MIQAVLETNTVRLFMICFVGFIVGLIVARKERAEELADRDDEVTSPPHRLTSDEAFARWVVGLAFDGKRPSSVVSLLVQAVHEARKASASTDGTPKPAETASGGSRKHAPIQPATSA